MCESVDWSATLKWYVEHHNGRVVSSNGKPAIMMEAGNIELFFGQDGEVHAVVVGTTQKASKKCGREC